MSIWNKLGFGTPPSDNPAGDPAAPDEATPVDDLTNSREVIHNSSGDSYWDEFEAAIKVMTPRELNLLNYRLRAGVPDNSDWRTYVETFRSYQWFRFCEAYRYATGQTFTV